MFQCSKRIGHVCLFYGGIFFFAFYPTRPFWSATLTEIFANNTLHAGAWCFNALKINRFSCKGGETDFALKVSYSSLPAEKSWYCGDKVPLCLTTPAEVNVNSTERLAFRILYIRSEIIFSFWILFSCFIAASCYKKGYASAL